MNGSPTAWPGESRLSPERLVRCIVTCEHAGNRVPAAYLSLFRGADDVLASHRGWDIGAASLASAFAQAFDAPLHLARYSRLLVDLNRSESHPRLYSEYTRGLGRAQRWTILEHHYRPYRQAVVDQVESWLDADAEVLHLSVHSFTPELDGKVRRCDVGLLYDPGREREKRLALAWQALLRESGDLVVRRNYPYTGVQDGFVPWLRKRFPADRYTGVELEVNQRLAVGGRFPASLQRPIVTTFMQACSVARHA